MKTTQKRQLNLIDPFFTEELDYKNDYVSYIEVGGNSSVTPKSNNSEKPLNNDFNDTDIRSIDVPIYLGNCHIFSNDEENAPLFYIPDDCSSIIEFGGLSLNQTINYFNEVDKFSIFNKVA